MAQKINEEDERSERDVEMSVDETLSKESKRQRDGSKNIGAFGKRTGHSDLIFLEGVLPEVDGDVLSDRPVEEQVSIALDNLETVLGSRRNATFGDVMKVEIQLTDPSSAEAVDHVYESRFDDVELPPRTVVGVCSLPGGANVQLDVIAADE